MHMIFQSDSWLMQLLTRFSSLVVLNLLFLCTSIPIFTIGASLTAMYDVVFRMDTEGENKLAVAYFRAFIGNFKESTLIWLLFLLLMGTGCVNAVIFSQWGNTTGTVLSVITLVILCNALLILGYVFPLLSQFRNTKIHTLQNALLLGIANLPRTLVIAVINCFPWALLLMNLYAFIQLGFLWMVLYFAAAAYFNSRVLGKVFGPLKEQAEGGK